MRRSTIVSLLIVLTMTCSCISRKKAATDYRCGWQIAPSEMTDLVTLQAHIAQYPERWKATFEFLAKTDLDTLSTGRYDLLGDNEVYASVSEYAPKPEEDCRFEAHRTYIDLQYIISGEERMGLTTLEDVVALGEYDAQKDIVFFAPEAKAVYEVASPDKFYVFFPENVHRPSMLSTEGVMVKKIVVKIKN